MAEVCRFDEHAGTCDWIACENPDPSSPSSCPLPWPKADKPIRAMADSNLVARLRAAAEEVMEHPHPSQCDHLHDAAGAMREAADALAEQAETIERLRGAIQWVVTDAAYKAPEQINVQMAVRWMERLHSALAADPLRAETRAATSGSEVSQIEDAGRPEPQSHLEIMTAVHRHAYEIVKLTQAVRMICDWRQSKNDDPASPVSR